MKNYTQYNEKFIDFIGKKLPVKIYFVGGAQKTIKIPITDLDSDLFVDTYDQKLFLLAEIKGMVKRERELSAYSEYAKPFFQKKLLEQAV